MMCRDSTTVKPAQSTPDSKGEPKVLIWDSPTEVSRVEVPFEFADIPLP
jgi:hypothetical protein